MATDAMTNPALRDKKIERAFAHYDGDAPASLRKNADGSTDSVRINLARLVVDGYTSLTFGREVEITSDETAAISDAEAFIDGVWPMDVRMGQLGKLRTYGGVAGDAFARVVPSADGPRVIVLDPATVTVETDPMDAERETAYVITVETKDERGRTRYLRQRHEAVADEGTVRSWTITDSVSNDGRKFTDTGSIAWPSPLCQVIHTQNLPSSIGTYGTSDIEPDVLDLVEAANRAMSNAARIARLTASPIEWTRGITDERSQEAYEKRGPGSVAHLLDESQTIGIIESNGAGISSTIALYDRIVAELARVTAYPDLTSTDTALFGGASGRALEVRLAPMISRVEVLRRSYGRLIVAIAERLFAFAGYEPPTVGVAWGPILPPDPVAQAALAASLRDLGASTETVLETAGLDPQVEAARSGAVAPTEPADIGSLLDRLGVPNA